MAERYTNLFAAAKRFEDAECFIFDMDGLLFDTERLFMEQLAVVMAEKGFRLTREVYSRSLGMAGEALRELMCGIYGEDYPFEQCGRESRRRVSVIADTVGLCVKPEIRELLAVLRQRGIKCAVASSTASVHVREYLEKADLLKFFQTVIGGEMVKYSKPKPEIFLLACERCNVSPKQAVVLEDSENGIRAASAAGIRSICIPDLKMPDQEVLQLADALVDRQLPDEG